MSDLILAAVSVALGLVVINLFFELKRDLMMLQQNSYRPERYMRWIRESGDTTSVWRLLMLVVFFIGLTSFHLQAGAIWAVIVFAALNIRRLAVKKYKKPLVVTRRVARIASVAAALVLGVNAAFILLFAPGHGPYLYLYVAMETMVALYCCSHVIILVSVWLLVPVERGINNRYLADARRILASMPSLKIIGITGSYGKTSTKHFLHRILSEGFDTLMTPGSYNTTMGVVRTIREHLKPYNEVFIVEMGAKQPGDIKEICDLVHPSDGIVTAVGPQHLESFKTIENVRDTKFELIDSLPSDGLAVINNDFEKIATRTVDNVRAVRYAVTHRDGADVTAEDVVYSSSGTEFTVVDHRGVHEPLRLETRLLGECNVSDLLAAVIIARHLGMKDEKIRFAVSQIEPVIHRLSITRTPGGVTIVDDAFNSNPVGSRMALDVLSQMGPGRRILITPGMIELGESQDELNADFGEHAARCADLIIVVGEYNRDAITEGLRRGGANFEKTVRIVDSFAEARSLMASDLRPGDVVLYENDLPDTFK